MVELGGFFCRLFGPLLKTGFPLMKRVLKQLAENVLLPLGLTAATSATGASIQTKDFRSGTTTLVFSNEYLNDITKTIKSLAESGSLITTVSEIFRNKEKEQKGGFFCMLLGTLSENWNTAKKGN